MAVTPQMLVPAAISVPGAAAGPSFRLNQVTNTRPVAIAATTTGTPATPRRAISIRLSLIPTSTMPSRSTVVVQNFRPGTSAAGSPTIAQQQAQHDCHRHAGNRARP